MKRLYKSKTNKVWAGIIGGAGEYFNVDPVLLRLTWLLIVVFVAPDLVAYSCFYGICSGSNSLYLRHAYCSFARRQFFC
ncbi:MAG: Stress-responsive transcriptional regulator [Parcubacteria group bacterium GW2011_GWB1_40_14]|nr:MAG: Stress-responsive transcriptional regulator [Parcubacteria group bacterium GW2011_GWB1_40_14]